MRTPLMVIRAQYFAASLIAVGLLLFASVAAAAISFGTFSHANSNDVTVTQVTVNPPASVVAGDLLLANISINGGSAASTTAPSGWTQILRTDNDANISIISYYKVASANEPSSYTWTIDHQTTAKGVISRYGGVDASNPVDAWAGNTGYGTLATTSPVTTSASSEMIVSLFAVDVGKSSDAGAYFSTPSGMVERYDLSNAPFGPSTASDEVIQVSSGVTSIATTTITGNKARNWVSQQIALRPLPQSPFINGATTTATVTAATTSIRFPHTVISGSNQLLIVTADSSAAGEDTSATYAGITMTKGASHGLGTQSYYNYWYLINPPQGTADVVVNFPESSGRRYAAVTFANVDQTTPLDSDGHVGMNSVSNVAVPITTTLPNELIFHFVVFDNTGVAYTPNGTEIYRAVIPNKEQVGSARVRAIASTADEGGTMSSAATAWDIIAIPIRPAQ